MLRAYEVREDAVKRDMRTNTCKIFEKVETAREYAEKLANDKKTTEYLKECGRDDCCVEILTIYWDERLQTWEMDGLEATIKYNIEWEK